MFLTSLLGMLLQSKDPDGETFDVELLDEPLLEDEEEFVEISDQEVEEDSDSTAFVHLNEDARLIVADHSFVEDSFEKLSLRDAHDGIEVQIVHGSADIIRGIQKTVSESVGALLARIDTMEEAVGDFEKKISESCTFKSKFEQKESQCRELVSSSFQTSRVGRSNNVLPQKAALELLEAKLESRKSNDTGSDESEEWQIVDSLSDDQGKGTLASKASGVDDGFNSQSATFSTHQMFLMVAGLVCIVLLFTTLSHKTSRLPRHSASRTNALILLPVIPAAADKVEGSFNSDTSSDGETALQDLPAKVCADWFSDRRKTAPDSSTLPSAKKLLVNRSLAPGKFVDVVPSNVAKKSVDILVSPVVFFEARRAPQPEPITMAEANAKAVVESSGRELSESKIRNGGRRPLLRRTALAAAAAVTLGLPAGAAVFYLSGRVDRPSPREKEKRETSRASLAAP